MDTTDIDLAHQARVHEVHAIDNAHGACGNKVARDHAYRGTSHRRIGQALAKRGFDLKAQLARGLLRAVERDGVGNADALRILGRVALGGQLVVHLGAKAVHQHDFDAQRLYQRQILHDGLQLACRNCLTGDAHHKSLVTELVDIRCHRTEPGNEGEVEYSGHWRVRWGS